MSLGHMSFTFGGVTTPKPASPDSPIRAKEGNTQNTSRNPSTEVGKTTRSLRDDVILPSRQKHIQVLAAVDEKCCQGP